MPYLYDVLPFLRLMLLILRGSGQGTFGYKKGANQLGFNN